MDIWRYRGGCRGLDRVNIGLTSARCYRGLGQAKLWVRELEVRTHMELCRYA